MSLSSLLDCLSFPYPQNLNTFKRKEEIQVVFSEPDNGSGARTRNAFVRVHEREYKKVFPVLTSYYFLPFCSTT